MMGIPGPTGPTGLIGPKGDTGTGSTGPIGPPGPTGQAGDLHFVFTQNTPANPWYVTHNLGKYPVVTVVDSAETRVFTDVRYVDINNLIIDFPSAFSGQAYLN